MIVNSNPAKFLAGWATRNAVAAYREIQEKTMTNAIEQAKREMYSWLAQVKMIDQGGAYQINSATDLESALESYLELLRQDHEALHHTARARFEDTRTLEAANQELEASQKKYRSQVAELDSRLGKMTEERDAIQLRLHAVDHANKTQQDRTATPTQDSGDRASCGATEANAEVIRAAVRDVQLVITDWGMGDLKAKKAMRQIARIVNGDGTVADACGSIEANKAENEPETSWKPADKSNYYSSDLAYSRFVDTMVNGLGVTWMVPTAEGVDVTYIQAKEILSVDFPFKKQTCQHSFFAIGDDQMKCTFCGVGK